MLILHPCIFILCKEVECTFLDRLEFYISTETILLFPSNDLKKKNLQILVEIDLELDLNLNFGALLHVQPTHSQIFKTQLSLNGKGFRE